MLNFNRNDRSGDVRAGDKGLAKGVAEYKGRHEKQPRELPLDGLLGSLHQMIKARS